MTPTPDINLAVLAPIGFAAVGAMFVLMGEVFLSRAQTVMGREVTESFVGTALAITAMFFLALTLYAACAKFSLGSVEVFNPEHPLYQLDAFSALVTAMLATIRPPGVDIWADSP